MLLPNWATFAGGGTECGAIECAAPGGTLSIDFSTVTTLTAPDGSTTAPDQSGWVTWWLADQAATGTGTGHVPADALYGVWKADSTYFRVTHPDGTATDRPVYGVQLVVWYGA